MAGSRPQAEPEVVERAARITRERIAPRAAQYDQQGVNPVDSWRDLWGEGFLAAAVPTAHGGRASTCPPTSG